MAPAHAHPSGPRALAGRPIHSDMFCFHCICSSLVTSLNRLSRLGHSRVDLSQYFRLLAQGEQHLRQCLCQFLLGFDGGGGRVENCLQHDRVRRLHFDICRRPFVSRSAA